MKISKVPASRTAIFVIISFALLIIALFAIGNKQKLFSRSSDYFIKIKEISGLKEGAIVNVSGINVGAVDKINLPKYSGDSVVLLIHVVKDAQPLIHSDSRAQLVTEGLVGNKAISVTGGSADAKIMQPGDTLRGESPMEITSLLNNVSASINGINDLTAELTGALKDMRAGKGMLGKMLTDETLYNDIHKSLANVNNLTANLAKTSTTLGSKVSEATDVLTQTISEVKKLVTQVNSGNGTVSKLLTDDGLYREIEATSHALAEMITGLKDASAKLSKAAGNGLEVTEAFKHNFLVRDYFEQRGYWNAADFERTVEVKLDSLRNLQRQLDEVKKR